VNDIAQALYWVFVIGMGLLPLIGIVVIAVVGYKRLTRRPTRLGNAADGFVRAMNAGVYPESLRTTQVASVKQPPTLQGGPRRRRLSYRPRRARD
jgi:Flp pilus assembly protein TadB